jgi:hypothetical protein
MDPWEDDDGPSFPELDNELKDAEAIGDFLMNSEVLLSVGNLRELARVLCWKRDADGKVMGTTHLIRLWILAFMRSGFLMGELRSWLRMSLLTPYMPSVMPMGVLRDAIVDNCKDPSMAVAWGAQVTVADGKKIVKCSTRGWKLC